MTTCFEVFPALDTQPIIPFPSLFYCRATSSIPEKTPRSRKGEGSKYIFWGFLCCSLLGSRLGGIPDRAVIMVKSCISASETDTIRASTTSMMGTGIDLTHDPSL